MSTTYLTPNQILINTTAQYVQQELAGAEGGHDWWHIYRVWQSAKLIAQHEEVDTLIVELGRCCMISQILNSTMATKKPGPRRLPHF